MAETAVKSEGAEVAHVADGYLKKRRAETNSKLMRWGFGATAVGIGLMGAAVVLAPVIPFAATYTLLATGGLATWGLPVGVFGAIKNQVDKRRKY